MLLRYGIYFAIFLLLPQLAHAGGMSVQTFAASEVSFGLIVKVLLIDSKSRHIKVQLIRAFMRNPSQNTFQTFDELEPKSTAKVHDVRVDQLKSGAELILAINPRTEPDAKEWRIEKQYWDQKDQLAVGDQVIVLYSDFDFFVTTYSEAKDLKFRLLLSETELKAYLKSARDEELIRQLADQDFQKVVLPVLIERKALTPKLVANQLTNPFTNRIVLTDLLKTLSPAEQKQFLHDYAAEVSKLPPEKRTALLKATTNLPFWTPDLKLAFLLNLDQSQKEIRDAIFDFQRLAFDETKKTETQQLIKLAPLYVNSLEHSLYSSNTLKIEDFLTQLPNQEKKNFVQKAQNLFLKHVENTGEVAVYAPLIDQMIKDKDFEFAWQITKLDLTKWKSNSDQTKVFNAVLQILLASPAISKPEQKKDLLKFTDPLLTQKTSATLPLDPAVKEAYLKWGGYIYFELPNVAFYYQIEDVRNTMLKNISQNFDFAVLAEVVELHQKEYYELAQLKIQKVWGNIKDTKGGPVSSDTVAFFKKIEPDALIRVRTNSTGARNLAPFKSKEVLFIGKTSSSQLEILDLKDKAEVAKGLHR